MELTPGTSVADRYRVVSLLGQGGAAWVYRAEDTRVRADIALKVASPYGPADDGAFGARIQREAKIGFVLGRTPGIVRCLDWGSLPGTGRSLFMVLELIDGASPLELTKGGPAHVIRRLLTAAARVAVCHKKGVVHRDVKPQNFLVSSEGMIFLTDFGSAKLLGGPDRSEDDEPLTASVTQMGTLLGTPLYMAPEQFRDPAAVDCRADVFSLGVMLYMALTGRAPYQGANALEIMTNQVLISSQVSPPPPSPRTLERKIPERLERLCLSAISLSPEDRPADADAFTDELAAAAGLARSGAMRKPSAARGRHPLAPELVRSQLGVDPNGFATLEALREAEGRLGTPRFHELLERAILLLVDDERVVDGATAYLGRVAVGVPRDPRGARVTVGRSECDLTLDLVTVSKLHLVLEREVPGRWFVVDVGSSNGTRFNGGKLEPGQRQPLVDGDELRVSDHVSLLYASSSRVCRHLGVKLPTPATQR